MSIGNIYGIASAAMAAQRTAMEVAGENIANVNTEGYSRQTVNMETRLSINPSGIEIGTGVQVTAVLRSYDAMLQQQLTTGSSSYQQNLARETALLQIQPSFNEVNSNGLGASIASFFDAWQDLSTNPQGSAERQALLSKSQVMVDNFHNTATNLTAVAESADRALVGITAEVSDNARHLAQVNSQIITTQALGGNANTLLDQRDLLLNQLSEKVGISYTLQSDGTATVSLPGGETLVNVNQYATLYTRQNGATPPENEVLVTALGNPPPTSDPAVDTDVSGTVGGTGNSLGKIGGTLQVRDSIVPGYLDRLNEIASTLVNSVNAQHGAGYAVDGSTGNNFFLAGGVTGATVGLDGSLTWAKISAAGSDPTAPGGGAGNNANALLIAGIKDARHSFSTGSDTIGGFYNAQASQVGVDVQGAQNLTKQGDAFLMQMRTLRSSTSGVSLDEELTNLIKYQQAFQGATKLLNVANDMVDALLGMAR